MNRNQLIALTKVFAFSLISTCIFSSAHAQTSVRSQIAELSQRFNELEQKYNLLKLEVSNLTSENMGLKREIAELKSNTGDSDVQQTVDAKLNRHQKDTEAYIKAQYEKMMALLSNESSSTPREVRAESPTPAPTGSATYPKNGFLYTVKMGDTLSKIAKANGSNVKYIQAANKLSNPNSIQVGQKLFIPVDKN